MPRIDVYHLKADEAPEQAALVFPTTSQAKETAQRRWNENSFELVATFTGPDYTIQTAWHDTNNIDQSWVELCKNNPSVALAPHVGGRRSSMVGDVMVAYADPTGIGTVLVLLSAGMALIGYMVDGTLWEAE